MKTDKLDFLLEDIKREILLDLMHAIEDLTARKPILWLMTSEQKHLLDYLFADGLYPITEDRDYREIGAIFVEDD
jgi:hypothetical protein